MTRRKLILLLMAILIIGISSGCGAPESQEDKTIRVGVAFYPMKDLLLLIEDDLEADGFELVIEEFSDYQVPNNSLFSKVLDANMIQHDYFLQMFNNANNANLVTVQPLYHAIFALYSDSLAAVDDVPEGASITLPDDSTNLSRAIYLLNQAGLIEVEEGKTTGLTLDDIVGNPKNLKFDDQVPLTSLAQRYTETGLAVMYPTYARSLELEGDEQRLYVEKQDAVTEGFAISLVARADNQDSEKIKSLKKHLTGDEVRAFLEEFYGWASTPAF